MSLCLISGGSGEGGIISFIMGHPIAWEYMKINCNYWDRKHTVWWWFVPVLRLFRVHDKSDDDGN